MDAELEQMVRELHAKQAIREAAMTYSRGLDRQDKELFASCYHPDGIDDHGMFVGGADKFFDWTDPSHLKYFKRHQHFLGNHLSTLDGNTAHAETYYIFIGMSDPDDKMAMFGGRYLDRLEKRDGKWKISARKCLVEWWGTEGAVTGEWAEAFAQVGKIAKNKTDASYDRPLTVDPKRVGICKGI